MKKEIEISDDAIDSMVSVVMSQIENTVEWQLSDMIVSDEEDFDEYVIAYTKALIEALQQ